MDMTLAGVVAAAGLAVTIFQAANSRTGTYTSATRAIELAKKLGDELDRTEDWQGRDKVESNRRDLLTRASYATQEYLDMTVPKRINLIEGIAVAVIFGILAVTSFAPVAFPAGLEFLRYSAVGVFGAGALLTARQVFISWRRMGVEEALNAAANVSVSAKENEIAQRGSATTETP